ncbi:hypothetical protein R6Q59_012116 [Mikania micrantha]
MMKKKTVSSSILGEPPLCYSGIKAHGERMNAYRPFSRIRTLSGSNTVSGLEHCGSGVDLESEFGRERATRGSEGLARYDAWVTFLDTLHIHNYVEESKDYLRIEFAKFVKWFYNKHFNQKDKKYPPKLPNDCAIELLDLCMYVEDAGGYTKAAKDNKWPE